MVKRRNDDVARLQNEHQAASHRFSNYNLSNAQLGSEFHEANQRLNSVTRLRPINVNGLSNMIRNIFDRSHGGYLQRLGNVAAPSMVRVVDLQTRAESLNSHMPTLRNELRELRTALAREGNERGLNFDRNVGVAREFLSPIPPISPMVPRSPASSRSPASRAPASSRSQGSRSLGAASEHSTLPSMGFDNPHDIRSAGSPNEQLRKLGDAVVDLNVNYWLEVHGNSTLQATVQFNAGEMLHTRANALTDLLRQSRELGQTLADNSQGELRSLQREIRRLIRDITDVTGYQPSQERSGNAAARRLGVEEPAARVANTLRGQGQASNSTGRGASTSTGFRVGR